MKESKPASIFLSAAYGPARVAFKTRHLQARLANLNARRAAVLAICLSVRPKLKLAIASQLQEKRPH